MTPEELEALVQTYPLHAQDMIRGMYGGPDTLSNSGDRYSQAFDATHAAQLAQAEEMYQNAGQQGTLQAAQMRGQGLQQTMGGLGGGGLEARQALMGAGQASWGAGQEGSRTGSSERLAASEMYMGAQSDRARYDQANAGAWQQRFNIDQQLMRDADAAHRAKVAAEEAAAWQLGGAVLGAGSAGLASAGKADDRDVYDDQGRWVGSGGGQSKYT